MFLSANKLPKKDFECFNTKISQKDCRKGVSRTFSTLAISQEPYEQQQLKISFFTQLKKKNY
jgi:hypothetical protein